MSILFTSYLNAISRLKEEMKQAGHNCREIDIFELRLQENIDKHKYGDTKENLAERNEILGQLNNITRNIYGISFSDYCQAVTNSRMSIVQLVHYDGETSTLPIPDNDQVQATILDASLSRVQQATRAIVSSSEYIVSLQEKVSRAQSIFNDHALSISQERCQEALSSFVPFDCSSFPAYNASLYRAKTRLQNLKFQVNKLLNLCEICNDIDQPSRSTTKSVQELSHTLSLLSFDLVHVKELLDKVDIEMSAQ